MWQNQQLGQVILFHTHKMLMDSSSFLAIGLVVTKQNLVIFLEVFPSTFILGDILKLFQPAGLEKYASHYPWDKSSGTYICSLGPCVLRLKQVDNFGTFSSCSDTRSCEVL